MSAPKPPSSSQNAPQPQPERVPQRVLVTGASHGLGAALAHEFARAGHRVFLVARNGDELAARAADIAGRHSPESVAWQAADLRDPAAIAPLARAAEAAFGGIDVLVNNAGIGAYRPFVQNSVQELVDLVALNLQAPMLLAHALLPGMLARGGGYLIDIASDLARRPLAQMAPYVASKYGLLGFGASLHRELRAQGLRVTTVMPGIIDSAFNGAVEGSKDARWALPTGHLAQQVVALLALPPAMLIDELVVHPVEGDY